MTEPREEPTQDEIEKALTTADRLKKLNQEGEYARLDYDEHFVTLAKALRAAQEKLTFREDQAQRLRELTWQAEKRAKQAEHAAKEANEICLTWMARAEEAEKTRNAFANERDHWVREYAAVKLDRDNTRAERDSLAEKLREAEGGTRRGYAEGLMDAAFIMRGLAADCFGTDFSGRYLAIAEKFEEIAEGKIAGVRDRERALRKERDAIAKRLEAAEKVFSAIESEDHHGDGCGFPCPNCSICNALEEYRK